MSEDPDRDWITNPTFVYKIESLIDNRCDIGLSRQPYKRMAQHAKAGSPLGAAIRAQRQENFTITILFVGDEAACQKAERDLIQFHRAAFNVRPASTFERGAISLPSEPGPVREAEMDGSEMRARRKALKLSQADFADRIGMGRDHVGRMERGIDPILPRTAAGVRHLKPDPLDRQPSLSDPMERIVEAALIDAGIRYETDFGGGTASRLDFHLVDFGIEIEVKRFYSSRTGEQMARAPNVIVAQGEAAIRFLAAAIRSGDFFAIATSQPEHGK